MEVELSSREFLCFTTYHRELHVEPSPNGSQNGACHSSKGPCVLRYFPDLIHKIMEVYIDDFIVWAQSEDELINSS